MVKASERSTKKRRLLVWSLVLVLALLIVSFRLVEDIGHEWEPFDRFIVKRVLDGDSVELQGGDRLRLLAVDTPEKGQRLYDEAMRFLDSLTIGQKANITYAGRRRDRYGRLLGFLYIDTLFINRLILQNGLGYLYLFRDTEINSPEIRGLLRAQRDAIENKVGLHGIERTPEEYYVAMQGSFRYHRPGCRAVRDLKPGTYRIFETREEALYEGLSPCRNCRP